MTDSFRVDDEGAERAALGAMMLSRTAIDEVLAVASPGDFYQPAHELICTVIAEMHDRGDAVDLRTVSGELFRRGELGKLPNAAYVVDLSQATPTAANAGYYAREVRERAILRRVVQSGTRIVQMGQARDGGDVDAILAAARQELDAIGGVGRTTSGVGIAEAVSEWLDRLADPAGDERGWDWPWRDLNDLLLPARPGQLVVFGARPKIGKSTALVDCIRHFAFRKKAPTVFFSLEMPREEITGRIMSAESGVDLKAILTRELTDDQWARLLDAQAALDEAPLTIFTEEATLADLRAAKRAHGAQVVGYDYLQLAPLGQARDASQRGALLGQFAQGLKAFALAEQVLMLTAAQFNRGPEQRTDKRPQMADFRETGAIEQALDVAVLLHRPEAYNPTDRPGECDFIVDGQRNGPRGTRTVVSQLHFSRFANFGRA